MATTRELDEVTGTETTGHEWDGIKELDTPLPRWWLWIFYACIVWSFAYWIAMPAWPLISSYTGGVLGYSSRANLVEAKTTAQAAQGQYLERISAASLDEIAGDQELLSFALAGGRSAFAVNCSQCHGSGAQGFVGYPNLNDDDWLWGGTLEDIYFTIAHGVRNTTDDEARFNDMPAFGRDEILDNEQIGQVVEYVLKLSGQEHDAALAEEGMQVFVDNCAACHMEDGTGMTELGAPDLTDAIWLYGGDRATIRETVANSRGGVMPAWGQRLAPETVKQLAVYVHSLGGGQ